MNLIEIKHLSLFLQENPVLENISFHIAQSEFVALLGPNGAGKSSLIKALLGISEGRISGQIHFQMDRKQISYIPQRIDEVLHLPVTVEELFLSHYPGFRFFFRSKTLHRHFLQHLENFGVAHTLKRHFPTLSGGEKQRVLLAISFLQKPKLLILDEPVSGVDIEGEKTFFALLESLRKDGTAVLLISHDIDMVSIYVDRVICLNKKIICEGIPQKTLTTDVIDTLYKGNMTHYHHHH